MDAADDVIKSAHSAPLTFEELSSRRGKSFKPCRRANDLPGLRRSISRFRPHLPVIERVHGLPCLQITP